MDTIIYILLFAIATVIIYTWGLFKEQRKSKDLYSILYKKSERAIIKSLKKNGCLSKKDIEHEICNIKASLFYSKDKLIIREPSQFAKSLIGKMLQDGIIFKTTNGYSLKSDSLNFTN